MSSFLTTADHYKVASTSTSTSGKDKRERFARTSSIEKIIKFNAYICSQNYFVLPAILAWLKTSQSVLHANLEKMIFFMKYLIFSSMAYKMLESNVESMAPTVKHLMNISLVFFAHYRDTIRLTLKKTARTILNYVDFSISVAKKYLFIIAVYFTVFAIFAQAMLCASFVISTLFVTGGATFLCICLYFMAFIYLKILLSYLKRTEATATSDNIKMCDIVKRPKNLSTKLENNNKTLSSLNLH